jgi:hypothetical protein
MVSIEKFSVLVDYEAEDRCLLNVLFQFSTFTYVNVRIIIIPNGTTFSCKTDLFTGLAKDAKPLAEALQSAVVHMLNDRHHNVFH